MSSSSDDPQVAVICRRHPDEGRGKTPLLAVGTVLAETVEWVPALDDRGRLIVDCPTHGRTIVERHTIAVAVEKARRNGWQTVRV